MSPSAEAPLVVRSAGDEAAPPLVFLHGLLGDSRAWAWLDRHDPPSSYARCHYLDFRLAAPWPDPPTFDALAERTFAAIERCCAGRPLAGVVGSSLGGHLALHLVARRNLAPERLLLFAPAGVPGAPRRPPERAHTFRRVVDLSAERIFGTAAVARDPSLAAEIEQHRRELLASRRVVLRNYVALLRSMDERVLGEAELRRVRVPALLVWGRRDEVLPAATGERLAELLPDARLELLDAGHAPHVEEAAACAALIRECFAPSRSRSSRSARSRTRDSRP